MDGRVKCQWYRLGSTIELPRLGPVVTAAAETADSHCSQINAYFICIIVFTFRLKTVVVKLSDLRARLAQIQ